MEPESEPAEPAGGEPTAPSPPASIASISAEAQLNIAAVVTLHQYFPAWALWFPGGYRRWTAVRPASSRAPAAELPLIWVHATTLPELMDRIEATDSQLLTDGMEATSTNNTRLGPRFRDTLALLEALTSAAAKPDTPADVGEDAGQSGAEASPSAGSAEQGARRKRRWRWPTDKELLVWQVAWNISVCSFDIVRRQMPHANAIVRPLVAIGISITLLSVLYLLIPTLLRRRRRRDDHH